MLRPSISHLGIAVQDLESAIERYRTLLGADPTAQYAVADQKVRVAFFDGEGAGVAPGGRIELLQATSADSPVARFIERRGEGLHHICIYVDNLETRLVELKAAGVRLIDESPRLGADGHRIAFVHPSGAHGVLIELEER